MNIRNVTIEGSAMLAPMAGVADAAVRAMSRKFGAACAIGEMASAKGIVMGSRKSVELLRCDRKRPFAVQLFGADPSIMAQAARVAQQENPDFIDLNFGCPAPKVTRTGAGSALLRDLPLAGRVAAAVVAAVRLPVTVKLRIGYDTGENVAVEAARCLEAVGVAALTVHGRTRAQMYAPPVDLKTIAAVKRAVSIPVVGNGDIFTADDAKEMFEETGCDMVMVGRGALGNPWIFAQIKALLTNNERLADPTIEERLAVLREEIALLIADKGNDIGYREARKHVAWYMSGLRGAAALRRMCGAICGPADIENICGVVMAENGGQPKN